MEDKHLKRELCYWLALARGPAVSGALLAELAAGRGRIAALFESGRNELPPPAGPALCKYLRTPDWTGVEADLRWLDSGAGTVLPYSDASYPDLLRNISDPPPALFVRGCVEALNLPQLAVVGTRNPTPDGIRQASHFASELARLGIGITSGLALGIDAEAHCGALAAGGITIAVLGNGPDQVYPRRNAGLAERIVARGAVITEFGVGTRPVAINFPRRNRIISGLSLGTVVVEAAMRSGSLITAGTAAAQGREVFAVPGSIRNPMARGCHHLIKQGAKLVAEVGDILEEIRELAPRVVPAAQVPADRHDEYAGLDENARLLLDSIGFGPVATDELVDQTGLAAGITASLLSCLEISGHIEILPGGRIIRR
ncbi:MAG: DNA-protecting protein DprA [Gammaproteobacteria bacterium]|nr:DNA-protecting protein DprA [Gammaproteobacteria bacterium]